MLVETDPVPHQVVDIRTPNERHKQPLPSEIAAHAVHIPTAHLAAALADEQAWREACGAGAPPMPTPDHLVLLLGGDDEQQKVAAAEVADAGFDLIGVLEHGIPSFQASEQQAQLRYISRDALALLLGHPKAGPRPPSLTGALVLDLRRPDERALYGQIQGTVALPVEQLGAAFQASCAEWQQLYRTEKPPPEALLVMQCRTNRRASWAAQLAADAGYARVLVYKQGVYKWRLDASVKPYGSYEVWDPPPEPDEYEVEGVDARAAHQELQALGVTLPSQEPQGASHA